MEAEVDVTALESGGEALVLRALVRGFFGVGELVVGQSVLLLWAREDFVFAGVPD